MATLQERINQISPYDAAKNPTGSKKVLTTPERQAKPANEVFHEFYKVIWTDNGGDTYNSEVVRLISADTGTASESWNFTSIPAFFDSKERTFKNALEDEVKTWWTVNKDTLGYTTRSNVIVLSVDMGTGAVDCTFIIPDNNATFPRLEVHRWYFIKKGSNWIVAGKQTQRVCDEPIVIPETIVTETVGVTKMVGK